MVPLMITCENIYLTSIPIMPSFFRFVLVVRLYTHKLFFLHPLLLILVLHL